MFVVNDDGELVSSHFSRWCEHSCLDGFIAYSNGLGPSKSNIFWHWIFLFLSVFSFETLMNSLAGIALAKRYQRNKALWLFFKITVSWSFISFDDVVKLNPKLWFKMFIALFLNHVLFFLFCFLTDIPGLMNPGLVESLQSEAQLSLNEYVAAMHPADPLRFARVLLSLPPLRNIRSRVVSQLFFRELIGDVSMEDLLKQMLLLHWEQSSKVITLDTNMETSKCWRFQK